MPEIDYERLAYDLGPKGHGYAILNETCPEHVMAAASNDLNQPGINWYTQVDFETNQGNYITQRFDVYALKLSRGDRDLAEAMPGFLGIAKYVEREIVKPLTPYYPSLKSWEADEVTAQRYPPADGQLSWHRDLPQHPGIIATLNEDGIGILSVEVDGVSRQHPLRRKDIFIQRAPGLFSKGLLGGKGLRRKHAVSGVAGRQGRTSITVRANNNPDKVIPGFRYQNWQ